MTGANVLANKKRPSENDLREVFAIGLAQVQGSKTDQDVADCLNWSIGTVRNCRNRNNTLSAKMISDAISADARFVEPFLALHGLRPCTVAPVRGNDRAAPRRLSELLYMLAKAVEDGSDIDDFELAAGEAVIADGGELLDGLRDRLTTLRRVA
jgi:hypothetical protein